MRIAVLEVPTLSNSCKGTISMTIYKKSKHSSKIYRKIYEQHYGPIPKDSDGRSYEIHHIDGNPLNNDPLNLAAVSIQEHYDIHYSQGDWAACRFIAIHRMNKTSKEISELSKKAQLKRIEERTHNFLNGDYQRKNQLKRLEEGTHNFLGKDSNAERIKNGTHNWLGPSGNKARIDAGTHESQIMKTCEHCGKTMGKLIFGRYHGKKCKLKPPNNLYDCL